MINFFIVIPDLSQLPWKIHPAADLFPMMTPDEFRLLVEDIKTHGLLDPIWLHDHPKHGLRLLDGRNRALACLAAGVEIKTATYSGHDPIRFSLSKNAKRRHQTLGQKAMAALAIEEKLFIEVNDVSRPNILMAKRVKDGAPDLAEKVWDGSLALSRADRILRNRIAQHNRIEIAKKRAATTWVDLKIDLRHGDFRDVLADLSNVDAIITDPPYEKEYLPLLSDLGAWSDKVLKPDGILVVLLGQTYLPEAIRLLDGYRPYRWTAAYISDGAGWVSYQRRIQSNWKPVLIYGGGPRMGDIIRANDNTNEFAKEYHRWGQNFVAFSTLLRRLTEPGQTVVDPFVGGGTTLLAARSFGCHVVGADIEEESIKTTRDRLLPSSNQLT